MCYCIIHKYPVKIFLWVLFTLTTCQDNSLVVVYLDFLSLVVVHFLGGATRESAHKLAMETSLLRCSFELGLFCSAWEH